MAPPFSSSNYKTTIINSSQIIDRGIKGIDIELATIELNNLSAAAIASLSGGGGGLTENSVNSSHIINGTIGTEDISDNAITGSKIADGTITYNKLIPFGIIRIINQSLTETNFDYDLYVYNTTTDEYEGLVSAIRLKKSVSFSHFYQIPFNVSMKLVVSSAGGIAVQSFNILQGATQLSEDGNELVFTIDTTDTNYKNIEISVEVAI
jgi:hypothetical protein